MTQHEWRKRYGKANEHSGMVPRDSWLEGWEKQAILGCHAEYPP
jgi:putative transposase